MKNKKDETVVWEAFLKPGKPRLVQRAQRWEKESEWEGQGCSVNYHNLLRKRNHSGKLYDFFNLCSSWLDKIKTQVNLTHPFSLFNLDTTFEFTDLVS